MKKVALILGTVVAVVGTIVVVGPRLLRDPEVSNPVDVADGADGEGVLPPDMFTSDPDLLKPAAHLIVERVVDEATDAGMEGAPYFVELADRRYVFGHSDRSGRTTPIYTKQPIQHRVYWYDDALAKWNERRPSARDGVQAGRSDGAAPTR